LNELSANELYGMTHLDRCNHPALIAESIVGGACTMIDEAPCFSRRAGRVARNPGMAALRRAQIT